MSEPSDRHAAYEIGFSSLNRSSENAALSVDGKIPDWLSGNLIRTGPAKFEVGNRAYNHWFDGLAMLHRFAISSGAIRYSNRFLNSRSYREASSQGKIRFGEFATDPCRTIFQRFASFFSRKLTDNGNVNVEWLGEHLCALTETRLPVRFDPATLEALGHFEISSEFPGPVSTAHPHHDHQHGLQFTYLVDFGYRSKYRVLSIDQSSGKQAELATIPVEKPAYMHSFGMTERYLVLAEFPLVVHPLRLKFSGQPFIRNYRWQPERGLRIHVLEKTTGRIVRQAAGPACFAFHHVNAFEQDDAIVIDLVAYEDASLIEQLYLTPLRSPEPTEISGKLTRLTLAADGAVTRDVLFEQSVELPRFNYQRQAGRPYRFVYAAGNSGSGDFLDNLVKFDLTSRVTLRWQESNVYPGEPVFVATPDATREDDGIILSVALDAVRETSFLLVLDATTFQEVARAAVPHHIPFGFHGNYYAK